MNLQEAKEHHLRQWHSSIVSNGGLLPMEADDGLNASSVDVIRAMEADFGEAWLVKVNLYDDDPIPLVRAVPDHNNAEYNCFNFCCSLVTPRFDTKLEQMILDRKNAPYTGTTADYERITDIDEYAHSIGAVRLTWS